MAPVSAADRQLKWRALLKQYGKFDDYKKRNAAQNRKTMRKRKMNLKIC